MTSAAIVGAALVRVVAVLHDVGALLAALVIHLRGRVPQEVLERRA